MLGSKCAAVAAVTRSCAAFMHLLKLKMANFAGGRRHTGTRAPYPLDLVQIYWRPASTLNLGRGVACPKHVANAMHETHMGKHARPAVYVWAPGCAAGPPYPGPRCQAARLTRQQAGKGKHAL